MEGFYERIKEVMKQGDIYYDVIYDVLLIVDSHFAADCYFFEHESTYRCICVRMKRYVKIGRL